MRKQNWSFQFDAQTKPMFVFHSLIIEMMWLLVKIYILHIHGKTESSKHTLNHIQILLFYKCVNAFL